MPKRSDMELVDSVKGVKIYGFRSGKKKPCVVSTFLTNFRVTVGHITKPLSPLLRKRAAEVLGIIPG
ncbi:MAG: hypothetical protein UT48_C0027G0004 [Parcubacteria group bacterium GW2011_GWE2_39_37]|nr:MAG: hypothetical protein UT48_C0027G0004 [Parcubacteria group bacterium GW2011_GWE2_39_37]